MILAIHQPNFLPWLGFFDKISKCDELVILDDVQVASDGTTTRTKIRTPTGWTWISVPIDNSQSNLNEAKPLVTESCIKETRLKIDRSYGRKRIGINEMFKIGLLANFSPSNSLAQFNLRIIKYLSNIEGINPKITLSSDLNVDGTKEDRILNICKEMGADTYLSGQGGKTYLKQFRFDQSGIKLEFQDFIHPVYDQMYPGFEPNMSAIDKLFCTGGIL